MSMRDIVSSSSLGNTCNDSLTHGFGLLSLGVEDGELELGTHLSLGAADQQQVKRQVVFALFIQTLGIHTQTPGMGHTV